MRPNVTGPASRRWLGLFVVLGLGVLGASPGPGSGHGDFASTSASTVGAHASDLAWVPTTARTSVIGSDAERGEPSPTLLLVALGVVASLYPARAINDRPPDAQVDVPAGLARTDGARAPPVTRGS